MADTRKGNGRRLRGRPSVQPAMFSKLLVLRQQGGRLRQEVVHTARCRLTLGERLLHSHQSILDKL